MWRLLSRYVFREILSSSLLATFLASAVIFLQRVDRIFELLVSSNGGARAIATLFALAVPGVLPLTVPFGVLVGILIGLGRMASDGEITAMRAAGVSSRRVIAPVMLFATLAAGLAAYASIRLTPISIRESLRITNALIANRLSAEIQPRVFVEGFPNTILYVRDVRPGETVVWRPVFIADITPPEQRSTGMREKAQGPLITVAREAIAISDPVHNRIQLSLQDAWNYEMGKDGVARDSSSTRTERLLDAQPPALQSVSFPQMNTRELWKYSGPDQVEARAELHRRFALPVACLTLALLGIPLGIATRKGGKSAGYVIGVFLAFFCYNLSYITLIGLAKQRALPVPVASWLPNVVFGVTGLIFLFRMEKPSERDLLGTLQAWFGAGLRKVKSERPQTQKPPQRGRHWPLLPQVLDTYILSGFLFYVWLALSSFVSMTLVYNFFELMPDMIHNHIPLVKMFTYLFFLTPTLVYQILPISVLVAILVAFSVLSRQNEITAFKACGVSVHRLAMPVFITSIVFSGALFAFDYYYVPGANRMQDALRDEIKGRATQTYLNPDRKWIWGSGTRIFYYKYFDPADRTMAGVYVFELDPATFRLTREIWAERAHWERSLQGWVCENGWSSDFANSEGRTYKPYTVATFPELTEAPDYFLKEALQDKQMNFVQLQHYIDDLQQSGFDTLKLQVQLYRKFSMPLFAIIMAFIAVPFGFLIGKRGTMTGIGVSIGIALAYWGIGILFEKLGDVNQLPPAMAAWSPDALFSLAGLYLLMRMRS